MIGKIPRFVMMLCPTLARCFRPRSYVGFHTLNHKHYNEAVQRALTRLHAECIPALASELSSKRHPLFDSGETSLFS